MIPSSQLKVPLLVNPASKVFEAFVTRLMVFPAASEAVRASVPPFHVTFSFNVSVPAPFMVPEKIKVWLITRFPEPLTVPVFEKSNVGLNSWLIFRLKFPLLLKFPFPLIVDPPLWLNVDAGPTVNIPELNVRFPVLVKVPEFESKVPALRFKIPWLPKLLIPPKVVVPELVLKMLPLLIRFPLDDHC